MGSKPESPAPYGLDMQVAPSPDGIPVKLGKRVIQLFSKGLYSSPHKALEELVTNSYDAGATAVHVLVPYLADNSHDREWIAVVDNGEGMNREGLKNHWIIGTSQRRKGPELNS